MKSLNKYIFSVFIYSAFLLLHGCNAENVQEIPPLLLQGVKMSRPSVLYSSPALNNQFVAINSPIFVQFDREMDIEKTRNAFTLTGSHPSPGTFRWEYTRLNYDLAQPLTAGGTYTLSVNGNATAKDGSTMGAEYIVHFVAGNRVDTPYVVGTTPAQNASSVTPSSTIQIIFSRAMDTLSVENSISISPTLNGAFSWSADLKTLTFTPYNPMTNGTRYSLSINTGARDTGGIALSSVYSLSFQVGVDFTGPTVSGIYEVGNPAPLSDTIQGVSKDSAFDIVFSEPMGYNATNSCVSLSRVYDGSSVTKTQSWNATFSTMRIDPQDPLEPENEYRITISTCAADTAGNSMANTFNLHFTVNGVTGNTNSNYLQLTSVVGGAQNLSLNPSDPIVAITPVTGRITFTITFSHPLSQLSLPENVFLERVMAQSGATNAYLYSITSFLNISQIVLDNATAGDTYRLTFSGSRTGILSAPAGFETSTWMSQDIITYFKVQ